MLKLSLILILIFAAGGVLWSRWALQRKSYQMLDKDLNKYFSSKDLEDIQKMEHDYDCK